MRRVFWIAAFAVVLFLSIVALRRWIHHAQLELVPVLISQSMDAQTAVTPPAGAIASRMLLDVHEMIAKPSRPRLAVLTFDDGPYPVETPALAAVVAHLHVPAAFFLIGDDARRQPAIARRLALSGAELGNHTFSHPEMPALSYDAQSLEIVSGAETVRQVAGVAVRYFRPPHGNYDVSTIRAALASGESVVLWDVDPGDWRILTPDAIVELAKRQARAPAVILLHNGKDATIEALPRIVAAYRRAGFTFVTLAELERRVPLEQINDPVKVDI